MYLLMVVAMVGMNYTLKQRSKRTKRSEEEVEAVEEGEDDIKSSESIFEEGKGMITKVIEEDNDGIIDKGQVVNL